MKLSLIETQWVNTILSNSTIFLLTVCIGCEFCTGSFRPNLHLFDSGSMAMNNNDNSNDNRDGDEGTNNDNFIHKNGTSYENTIISKRLQYIAHFK